MVRFHTDAIRVPDDRDRPARFVAESRHSYACSPSSQSPCRAMAAKAIELGTRSGQSSPSWFCRWHTRSDRRRRVPASQLAPLALTGHFLVKPRMQTLTEADRQLENQLVGGQIRMLRVESRIAEQISQ